MSEVQLCASCKRTLRQCQCDRESVIASALASRDAEIAALRERAEQAEAEAARLAGAVEALGETERLADDCANDSELGAGSLRRVLSEIGAAIAGVRREADAAKGGSSCE